MKKIISLICAAILLFSFSAVAYAGYDSTSTPTKDYVQVDASLKVVTPIGTLEQFNESAVEPVKGRIFEVNFLIENKTKEIVCANEILAKFDISIIELATKDSVKLWTEAEDYGFDKTPEKIAINPNEKTELTYKIYAVTDKAVAIRIIHEEKVYDLEKDAENGILTFYFVEKIETTTETSTTTATETSTKPAETETSTTLTTTTTPTESAKNNTIVYPDSPNAVAPIEDEIPNTGSTKAIYIAAALAIAGAVALLIIKKKSDD